MDLYILKYNNYYNRIVKREVDLSSYLTAGTLIHTQYNVNYAPGDGVNMRQVLNSETYGDYAIYADGNTIVSRWFIIEASRNCKGQFGLTLRRDLVVDNFDTVLNADTFIEKAVLPDNDPMIFNKENMTVNQIKTSEELLKDETGVAWVVGYIPSNSFDTDTQITSNYSVTNADYTVSRIENFPLYGKSIFYSEPRDIKYYTKVKFRENILGYWKPGMTSNGDLIVPTNSVNDEKSYSTYYLGQRQIPPEVGTGRLLCDIYKNFKGTILTNLNNTVKNYTLYRYNSTLSTNELLKYNGKIIKDSSTNIFYKCNIIKTLSNTTEYTPLFKGTGIVDDILDQYLNKNLSYSTATGTIEGDSSDVTYSIESTYDAYAISLEQAFSGIKATIPKLRNHLLDQPYDMFCIPYGTLDVYKNGTKYATTNKEVALSISTAIAEVTGTNNIYDVQLLPYCPVRNMIKENGQFDIGNENVTPIYDSNNKAISVICWAQNSSFTFNINKVIGTGNTKINNECNMYRLVSPNYNGQFEFNVARNGGVNYFNVDCSYKPFTPYIHINPNYKLLYGSDFNDARGLICGGDFSLPQVSNAWANYQLTNKNYQNIFDREIQNMEVSNKIQNTQSIVSGVVGALGAGVGVGVATGNAGLGIGASLLSGIGGALDYGMQRELQNEALDYKRDMFNYQLGNIKALPDTISKIDAFNNVFALWPIIEYYTCTEEEKKAVANKIAYNSMSVGRIGKIKDFKDNKWSYGDITSKGYIKGSLIRVDIDEDTHYINELANEIYKGVYF